MPAGNDIFDPRLDIPGENLPRQASEVEFFHYPQVSNKYISPETSPGEGDYTLLSFSANQAVNYTVNISAAYDILPMQEMFFLATYGVYRMGNGTWLIATQPSNRTTGERRYIYLGIGQNTSSFSWQPLGLANNTEEIAVASNGSHICVVYLETFLTDVGEANTWPVRWVKYFSSTNYGATWTNGTLWDCSTWSGTTFSGISMDVTTTGYFECMWGFANGTGKDAFTYSTVWEVRKFGSGAWSTADNLTAFVLREVWGTAPQVMFNHVTNVLHVCVNNASTTKDVVLYLLEDGPEDAWTDSWTLATGITEDFSPRVFCAIDNVDGHYYFVNTTLGASEGVRNASTWKGVLGDYDYVETRQLKHTFFLFADNGPHMFVDSAPNPIGENGPGILDAESPLCFYRYNGSLAAVEEMGINFNGKDSVGNTHATRAFSFTIKIQSGTNSKTSIVNIGVDDTFPSLTVTKNTDYISPISSLGKNDSLELGLTSNKSGTTILTVESLVEPVHAKTNITNEVFNYFNPGLCGDGTNYYLFYSQSESESLDRLMMVKSTDGGLSWGDAVELDTSSRSYSDIYPILEGILIYCWYRISADYFLLASFNGGDTFVEFSLSDEFDAVAEDKSVWSWQVAMGADSYNLSRSLDLGFTWEPYLSIPAIEVGYYSRLESVAYDSQSKNYSFLFTNNTMGVMAIITDYEGTEKIVRENIAASGSPLNGNYQQQMQVDAWHNQTGEFNWIITCGNYNPFSFESGNSTLAFCLINATGITTTWDNFTAITGELMPCFFGSYDLIFPVNATPCYVRSIVNLAEMSYPQLEVSTATSFVYSTTMEMFADILATISFHGFSSTGGVLPEGEYKWTLHYLDQVGHRTFSDGFVTIDHTLPILGEHANFTTPEYAVPRLQCIVTIPAVDSYLSHAILRYRTGEAQPWTEIGMTRILISLSESNFTGVIPALGSAAVYWQVEIIDLAANSLIVDSNGQPYTYLEPQIRIDEQFEPPAQVDLTLTQAFNVSFIVPEFSEYVSYLYIEYTFDDGAGMHTTRLVAASQSIYYFTFDEIPENVTELSYTVYAVDLYGKITPLGRVRTVSLIPALPTWDLSLGQQLFAVIASLIVGIFTGLVYASLTRRRVKPVSPRDTSILESTPARMDAKTGFQGYKVAFIITALFIVGLLAGAFYFFYILQWFEAAMLCFLGTFLATTVLWILFMDSLTLKVFREGHPRIRTTFPLLVGFSIFIALLAMFMVGNNVAWWRVRINENPYVFFGIILPQLMTTLVATFFSSIIFLTRSIAKDVQRISKELADSELHNENPGRIFNRRETACQDILKSIGQKGVIFVAIIGITIVFASDLSAYAVQGILIILPFAGGALLTLFIINLSGKIKEKQAETILYDKLTTCPKCGKPTTLGGTYCEHCGEALIKGTRVVPAEACPGCGQLTPKGSTHCRYCNAFLPQNPVPNIKTGEGTPKGN